MSMPQHTKAWVLNSQKGAASLELKDHFPILALKDDEILVKLQGASLNHREIMIAKGGFGLQLTHPDTVPGSDGAGVVEAVGSGIEDFKEGEKVVVHLTYKLGDDEPALISDASNGVGHAVDGTLRQYGVFHKSSIVHMPSSLSFVEASTLTCSGLTAWNALFGLESKAPKKGDFVLVQGTGGVSIAALQFAVAAGATVIATTSSEAKERRLKDLGAHHTLNYRTTPDWGARAKELTPDGKGPHLIVDVGGNSTLAQSLAAIRPDGLIACAGILGDAPDGKVPTLLDGLFAGCTVRAIMIGTRKMFRDMNAFVEAKGIKPVLDERMFKFEEVPEAYRFVEEAKHFSKVGIEL